MTEDRVAIRLEWDAGARARRQGRTHLDNPHPASSDRYVWWFMGWRGEKHPAVETFRAET
jgi:hypothetical protein